MQSDDGKHACVPAGTGTGVQACAPALWFLRPAQRPSETLRAVTGYGGYLLAPHGAWPLEARRRCSCRYLMSDIIPPLEVSRAATPGMSYSSSLLLLPSIPVTVLHISLIDLVIVSSALVSARAAVFVCFVNFRILSA